MKRPIGFSPTSAPRRFKKRPGFTRGKLKVSMRLQDKRKGDTADAIGFQHDFTETLFYVGAPHLGGVA